MEDSRDSGKQKMTIRAAERDTYHTPRGHKGNHLPKGYRHVERIEVQAAAETAGS